MERPTGTGVVILDELILCRRQENVITQTRVVSKNQQFQENKSSFNCTEKFQEIFSLSRLFPNVTNLYEIPNIDNLPFIRFTIIIKNCKDDEYNFKCVEIIKQSIAIKRAT